MRRTEVVRVTSAPTMFTSTRTSDADGYGYDPGHLDPPDLGDTSSAASLARSRAVRHILLADPNAGVIDALGRTPSQLALEIVWAKTGRQAIAAARRTDFDLLLIDVALPDACALDVVRSLRALGVETPFIVMTGRPTVSLAVEAMTLGAVNVLKKPVAANELCEAVAHSTRAMHGRPGGHARRRTSGLPSRAPRLLPLTRPQSASHRWAAFVLHALRCEHDIRTLDAWSRSLAVSRSVLCEACRLVRVPPHEARDFARVLRAVCRCTDEWQPETVLDVADTRTLGKLLTRAGLDCWPGPKPPAIGEFLQRQQWIPQGSSALTALRALLKAKGADDSADASDSSRSAL
jgi:DNA-binding response OmpR family regulator